MVVNVRFHVETLECRPSSRLFRGSVNSSKRVRSSQPHCEGNLTLRGEVGFCSSSDTANTQHPIFIGGFN